MLQIQNTIISEDIINEQFVCNLSKCKGACCVEGDSGAPLLVSEINILKEIYPLVKHYLRKEGISAIDTLGTSVVDIDGDLVTPLIDGKECAYVIYDDTGCVKCGIEKAYEEKKINFIKPISCHLYPIRITEYKSFTALNYDEWGICKEACVFGESLKIKVYQFLKEPLIRKFGKEWYEELIGVIESKNIIIF